MSTPPALRVRGCGPHFFSSLFFSLARGLAFFSSFSAHFFCNLWLGASPSLFLATFVFLKKQPFLYLFLYLFFIFYLCFTFLPLFYVFLYFFYLLQRKRRIPIFPTFSHHLFSIFFKPCFFSSFTFSLPIALPLFYISFTCFLSTCSPASPVAAARFARRRRPLRPSPPLARPAGPAPPPALPPPPPAPPAQRPPTYHGAYTYAAYAPRHRWHRSTAGPASAQPRVR